MLDWLGGVSAAHWVDAFALLIFVVFWGWVLHKSGKGDPTYDLADNLKDPYSGKASPMALVYLSMALVALWWAVRLAEAGGDPSSFILTVITIFVAKAGAEQAISAWGRPPPPPPPPEPPHIEGAP